MELIFAVLYVSCFYVPAVMTLDYDRVGATEDFDEFRDSEASVLCTHSTCVLVVLLYDAETLN